MNFNLKFDAEDFAFHHLEDDHHQPKKPLQKRSERKKSRKSSKSSVFVENEDESKDYRKSSKRSASKKVSHSFEEVSDMDGAASLLKGHLNQKFEEEIHRHQNELGKQNKMSQIVDVINFDYLDQEQQGKPVEEVPKNEAISKEEEKVLKKLEALYERRNKAVKEFIEKNDVKQNY